jgi:hypothetical protein
MAALMSENLSTTSRENALGRPPERRGVLRIGQYAIVKTFLRTILPCCRDVSRLQSASTQQPLSLGQRIGLKFHLLVCSWCRRYGKQVGFFRKLAHQHDGAAPTPPSLSPNARERMKRSLRDMEK